MSAAEHAPVVAAMEAGAGLPVVAPMDRLLEQRSLEGETAMSEPETIERVLENVQAWLTGLEARTRERLARADEGPLKAELDRYLTEVLTDPQERTEALQAQVQDGATPWQALTEHLEELHGVREDVTALQRAGAHLEELARLVEDIPEDEDGRRALDELARREAEAAAGGDPAAWAQAARELEANALAAVRPEPVDPAPVDPVEPSEPPDRTREAGTPDANAEDRTEPEITLDRGHDASGANPPEAPLTNGHPTNGANDPEASPIPKNGSRSLEAPSTGRNGHHPARARRVLLPTDGTEPKRPERSARTGAKAPAGPEVLADWEEADAGPELRHGPFWAPILEGELVPADATVDEVLETAKEVEIDLVDLELPRVLAIPTGPDPAEQRHRIAERAKAITREDPTRPAREAFLDHLVGKLPKRYRETSMGLTLAEAIAHAVTTDDAWRDGGPDRQATIERMVEHELDRTPAIDLTELAGTLLGPGPEARERVRRAAQAIASEDPDVTFHEEGILVRALAAREDPDALYDLKQSLKRRLTADRAQELVETLVTTPEMEERR